MSPLRSAVALAAGIAALLSAAPAGAYTSEQIARYNAAADQVWPSSACNGRLHADVVDELPVGDDPQLVTLGQARINDATTCTYDIVAGLDDYEACVVVVHEAGHLAGYHSTDPAINPDGTPDWAHDRGATIMNPSPPDVLRDGAYRPCAQAVPITLTMDAAANWVEHSKWGRYMVTLDCRRDQIVSRQRCWGTSGMGRHLRWTVWRDGEFRVRGGRWK